MNDKINLSTLTERGQLSMPASLRRKARLKAGQKLIWRWISDREFKVTVQPLTTAPGPMAALGFARKFSKSKGLSSDAALKEIRAGDRD